MKKTVLVVLIVTLVSKILGFLRDIVLAFFFGASSVSDVYLIALTIPEVLFAFIVVGISTSYIPILNQVETKYGNERGLEFTNNLVNFLLIISTVVVFLTILFTGTLVKLFASGFEGDIFREAVLYTRITIFGVYFTGLIFLYKSFLQNKNSHVIPSLIGIPLNLIIILSIVLAGKYDEHFLPFGYLVAVFIQLMILYFFIYKVGYRYKWKFDLKDHFLKRMIYLTFPIILGLSINQINILVDRTLASQIVEGGIAALNYANKLNVFVQGIFIITLSNMMYPRISKMANMKDIKGLKETIGSSFSNVTIILAPASVIFMLFSDDIINYLFGYGAFDQKAIQLTSGALFFYSIGMIGFGLREVLSRGFYAFEDTKSPMRNAAISVIINVILNIILSKYMGLNGLALATSISANIGTALLYYNFRRTYGSLPLSFASLLLYPIGASIIMGVCSYFTNVFLTIFISPFLALVFSILLGLIIYVWLLFLLEIPSIIDLFHELTHMFLKKNKK